MPQFPNITLAILAGGKATRMEGRNKALLEIDGETFINRIHRSLSPLFQCTIIISNDAIGFQIPHVNIYPDIIKDVGPLGGIHSALVNSIHPFVFIVSCDMPFADATIAKAIGEKFIRSQPDILVPVINTYNEPLFAIYSKHLVQKIEALISTSNGKPIKDLMKIANTKYFNLPDNPITKRCFTNINSLEEFKLI